MSSQKTKDDRKRSSDNDSHFSVGVPAAVFKMKSQLIDKIDGGLGASAITNRDIYRYDNICVDTTEIWTKRQWTEAAAREYVSRRDDIIESVDNYYDDTLQYQPETWNWMGYVLTTDTVEAARKGDEDAQVEILSAILDCIVLSDRNL